MPTVAVAAHRRLFQRAPLAPLGKASVAAMLGFVAAFVYLMVVILKAAAMPVPVLTLGSLVVAGIVATGWRWTPLLGAAWAVMLVVGNLEHIVYDLLHPDAVNTFGLVVVLLVIAVIGVVAGVGATIQNYRSAPRLAPRGLRTAVVGLAMLALGMIMTALIPRPGAGAGVSAEVLAQLPGVATQGLAWNQTELHASIGETVALRIDNTDGAAHSFDIDAFNVHLPLTPGMGSLALFKPTQAGTYTFYCRVPGHAEAGMKGTLIVAPQDEQVRQFPPAPHLRRLPFYLRVRENAGMQTTFSASRTPTTARLAPIHALLSVQSVVVLLLSINRLSRLTLGYVLPNEFLRWVDLHNLLTLPLISVTAFYLLKQHLEAAPPIWERVRSRWLGLAFVLGVYLLGAGYGNHEVTNYLHARFCADDDASALCRIVIFNDDEFGHLAWFAGFVLINVTLLLVQAQHPQQARLTRWDVMWLVLNGLLIGAGIFANLAFEEIGLDLFVVAIVALLAFALWWWRGTQPSFVYYSIAYGVGLITATLYKGLAR